MICVPNESEVLLQMRLVKSLNRIDKNAIVIQHEPKNDFHTILSEEPNPEIGTPSTGRMRNLGLVAMTIALSTTQQSKTTIIDDVEYSEGKGNLFKFSAPEYFAEPTLATQGLINSDYNSPKMSLQKKSKKKNNRKTKKRKKAKNGR